MTKSRIYKLEASMFKWISLVVIALCPFTAQAASSYAEVNTNQLKQLIATVPNLVIVDARTPAYDNGQRIENAIILPYNSAEQAIGVILPKKDAPIVVYCWSASCPMSQHMIDRLVTMGYSNLYKYPEGLSVWINERGPINTVKK